MENGSSASPDRSPLKIIRLPLATEFSDEVDADDLERVGELLQNLEAWFATEDFDLAVKGEFGRTFSSRQGPKRTVLNSLAFRIAVSRDEGKRREITHLQSLLENPIADIGEALPSQESPLLKAMLIDNGRRVDILQNFRTNSGSLRLNRSRIQRTFELDEMQRVIPHRITFQPCRAALTGVDQILNGGAQSLGLHNLRRNTIKKVAKRNGVTFFWVEIVGKQASVFQIVAFENGLPVQIDQWAKTDESTNRIVLYETVRTQWAEIKPDLNLPVRLEGVRRHAVRPADFSFQCRWRLGEDIDPALFDIESLGDTPVYSEL